MKTIKKLVPLITQIALLNFLLIESAHAYFDYGTGSLLIQSMIAFFGMSMMYFKRIKEWVISLFHKVFYPQKSSIPEKKLDIE